MKILILGHKGMLGSDLMLRMMAAHDVTGKDVGDFDIAAEDDCGRVIAECSPEVVINAAAYTNVDKAEEQPEIALAVNATAVGNLGRLAKRQGVFVVHISTDFVFDGEKTTSYVETDKPNPLSVYGQTKRDAEIAIEKIGGRYFILRTAWLYSPFGKNFVKTFAKLGKEKPELKALPFDAAASAVRHGGEKQSIQEDWEDSSAHPSLHRPLPELPIQLRQNLPDQEFRKQLGKARQ